MPDTRRNPYLILGVDFGASHDEARRGFVRAIRRVRSPDEQLQYSEEDVTWALHQIEQIELDPHHAVNVYRVPADPAVFSTEAHGLLNPAADPLPRSSQPTSTYDLERLALAALREIAQASMSACASIPVPPPYS